MAHRGGGKPNPSAERSLATGNRKSARSRRPSKPEAKADGSGDDGEPREEQKRPSRPFDSHSSSERKRRSDGDEDDEDEDADNGTDASRFYDAKMDEGQTQMDLKVSADDPASRRSTDAVHAQAERERASDSVVEDRVNLERVRLHTPDGDLVEPPSVDELQLPQGARCVLYWMQREQRVEDSWPLLFARDVAAAHGLPLRVVFCMVPRFLDATERQYGYMIRGMQEVEADLRKHAVPFTVLLGYAPDVLPPFVDEHGVGAVVNDFNPLGCHREWVTRTAAQLAERGVAVYRVDGHNTVPMWVASQKLEYGARTIRGKIHKHLPTFLREYPTFTPPPSQDRLPSVESVDWKAVDASLEIDRSVAQVDWIVPGERAGREQLHDFLEKRLKEFNTRRNDPTHSVLSNMSCYLHYGMISAARILLEAMKYKARYGSAVASFIEEIVVRRELSDNFVWYEPDYNNINCSKPWARQSLTAHKGDEREFLYTLGEFECGVTHDDLWNAFQLQMTGVGKMHGFGRMYWAKKILEWTASPEEALRIATYLNDKYELDGRDPNGYVGIAWSILGIHDQGWRERPVFGKVRYMNYAGCKRKFNVAAFVAQFPDARVGSAGFKRNEARAKRIDEEKERTDRRASEPQSIKTEGSGRGGTADTDRQRRAGEEDGDGRSDRDSDGPSARRSTQRGARRRVQENKDSADDDGTTPAGGGKRAKVEAPH